MMKFRRFTPAGIAAARDYLAKSKAAAALDLPARDALIASPSLTESIPSLADLDFDPTRTFDTTFAFCEYLDSLLAPRNPQVYREDVGFWTYLAFAYLEQLVKEHRGTVIVGDESRMIFEQSRYGKSHRHLLASPYYFYCLHSDKNLIQVPLWHKPNTPGDIFESIIARQGIAQNGAYLMAIRKLYFRIESQKIKRSVGGPGASGGIRRFVDMVDQFGMTRDFHDSSDADAFIDLLPSEFSIFKL